MSATTLIGGGIGALVFVAGLLFILRGRANDEDVPESADMRQQGPPVSESTNEKAVPNVDTAVPLQAGPPASTGPPVSTTPSMTAGPPLPEGGLPAGWTQEQWEYYGQQYLDGTLDDRRAWTPILRHGTACGLLSLLVEQEHGIFAISLNGFRQREPLHFLARHRC